MVFMVSLLVCPRAARSILSFVIDTDWYR
jgi:hypothetical protein